MHLVALDEALAAGVRALPHDEQFEWRDYATLDDLQDGIRTLADDQLASVLVTVDSASDLPDQWMRTLQDAHRRLRVVVVVNQLLEGQEKRMVIAGVLSVVRPPFGPVGVRAWFSDRTYLDCLFPIPLEGERFEEHELLLPSRRDMVTAAIRHLCGRFSALGYAADLVRSTLPLVIDEAVTNAMRHGNQWDETKRVYVRARMRPEGFELVVSDEGEGFRRDSVEDPLAAQNVGREGGRGLFLMEQLMDEVLYEDSGSTVILRKGDFHRLPRPRRGVPEEITG